MRVKIYQINMDRDADNVKFMGTDARKSLHLKEAVDPSIYVARCSQYNEAKVGTEITEGENELWL